ncbi:hypothetical protein HYW84_00460 [Candidatus Peregrinibacteria bacterium]|nr:hypothetical protein [Candidatus Peregrinibacteria bacterium]
MHIFALETDIGKLKASFLSEEEREICTVFFHGFRFFLTVLRLTLWTFLIIGIAMGIGLAGLPFSWVVIAASSVWLAFVSRPLLRAYLDWHYDFILITTDKVILVNQSSIFHQKVTPMNLENFASASAETQFWNLFPFGILHFNWKEGVGNGVNLRYIPHAHDIASCISDAITTFQRRKDLRRYGSTSEEEQRRGHEVRS